MQWANGKRKEESKKITEVFRSNYYKRVTFQLAMDRRPFQEKDRNPENNNRDNIDNNQDRRDRDNNDNQNFRAIKTVHYSDKENAPPRRDRNY